MNIHEYTNQYTKRYSKDSRFLATAHYVDATLFHDIVTGRLVTIVLHLIDKPPMNMYLKKHTTVEIATYGSEFVTTRLYKE